MRVLQICSKPPLPAVDGGCLASYQLSKNLLTAGFDLTLMCLATEKHPYLPGEIDVNYSKEVRLEVVPVKTALTPLGAMLNLFEFKSIQERRFYHREFSTKLIRIIGEKDFDFIVYDGLPTCVYEKDLRKISKANMIYRSHNVEYSIFDQRKTHERTQFRKFYLSLQAARLMRFEMSKWNSMDAVLSISKHDIDHMIATGIKPGKTGVLPFGIEVSTSQFTPIKNSLFHLGAMDWEPNIQGLRWFVQEVWPLVHASHPDAELHLGGKNIARLKDDLTSEGIHIHEHVPDALTFTRSYDILIVPVQVGSGTRIKILQAMAEGNVVVSTQKGLQGIEAEHEKNAMIANDAASFVTCLNRIFDDSSFKESLRLEAKKLIEKENKPEFLSRDLKNWMIQI